MLEQLNEVEGVQAGVANHSGSIIRNSTNAGTDREKVAEACDVVLRKSNAKPSRLRGSRFVTALSKETWRGIERINELSTIEFRTLAVERLKEFAQKERLDKATTDQLVGLAEQEWEKMEKTVDPKLPPHKADWTGHCRSFAEAFAAKAQTILTAEQHDRLKTAINEQFEQ